MAPETWSRFVDDASPLPPTGPVPQRPSPAVGARVVRDDELPRLRSYAGDVHVVVGGGAGSVGGPAAFCSRHEIELTALEVTLRDDADPAGNARRVVASLDAARSDGGLADDVAVHLVVTGQPTASWLAAADEAAAADLALTFRLGTDLALDAWVDAALDRELPFALTGGTVADAVAALQVTARLWGDADDLLAARRWCRSWATVDVDAALDTLTDPAL